MSFSRWMAMVLAGALALAGCSDSNPPAHDAADDPPHDAADDPPIDAAPAAGPDRLELTGGTRMTGGTLVVDVQFTPIKP